MFLMIKRAIFVFTFVFLMFPAISQDVLAYFRGEAKSFISLNVGCAFPAGRYSQKTIYGNYGNPYLLNAPKLPLTGDSDYVVAGFANPGISISANGAWYFIKFLGIGLRVSVSQNFLAINKLNNAYNEAYNISEDNVYDFNFSTNDYYYSAYLAPGIYFSIPIIDNMLFFSLEAGFGPFYAHFPEFTCDYTLNDLSFKEHSQPASEWDFSYYLALGAKYKQPEGRFGFNFELSYNEFSPEYTITTTRGTKTVPTFYRNINLSAGVVLFLGR